MHKIGLGSDRYICTVLEEMRQCYKTRNFSYLKGLIEEAQSLADRMESALEQYDGIEWLEEKIEKLKKEKRSLRNELIKLKNEKAKKNDK